MTEPEGPLADVRASPEPARSSEPACAPAFDTPTRDQSAGEPLGFRIGRRIAACAAAQTDAGTSASPRVPVYPTPRYVLEGEIGAGSSGSVWRAHPLSEPTHQVAVKFLQPDNPELGLLALEVDRLKQLSNIPGFVHLLDSDLTAEWPYYVLTYADLSLRRYLNIRGPLLVSEATRLFTKLVEAVGRLHAMRPVLCHCDLKPDNVMLTTDGQPLVSDLGLIRRPTLGTFFYMPPEQADLGNDSTDPRWDVYALGAIFYSMVNFRNDPPRYEHWESSVGTGGLPSLGFRLEKYRDHLLSSPPPSAHRSARGMDRRLAAIIDRCLELHPERRYRDAGEVAEALRARERGGPASRAVRRVGETVGGLFTRAAEGTTRDREPGVPSPPPPAPPSWFEGSPRPGRFAASPSCLAAVNPVTWLRPQTDPVDCSVYAPPAVLIGGSLLVQVFAHRPERVAESNRMATAFDADATGRGFARLEVDVRRGTDLAVHLLLPGFDIPEPVQRLLWRGQTTPVQFAVTCPSDLPPGTKIGTARVCLGGVPVGHVKFRIDVLANTPAAYTVPEPAGFDARPYRKVFVSYASADRSEVLRRVQMLRALRMQVFQDVIDLEPGTRWARELYRHIDSADLFLLFWSSAARKSEWVGKELRYALGRKAGNDLTPPEILPVVIEGPPPPEPPAELAHLHVFDPLLYFITHPATSR